jgi:hypothetical protein
MAFQDIRKSRKRLRPEEIRIVALFVIVLAGLLSLNIYLARILPGGEWLYQRWEGVHALLDLDVVPGLKFARTMPDGKTELLVTHAEPYAVEVGQSVQQIVYGRNAFSNEYAYILNDPFYIVLFYIPLVLIPNLINWLLPSAFVGFVLVRGIWMFLSEAALVMTVLFSFRLSEWEPPRWLYFILMFFGLFGFFSLNALITASPTIFLGFSYLCILLALRSFSDELAGGLLLLVAYQWEVGALFFLSIMVFVIINRRWNVLMGFGMTLVVLLIVSFLIDRGWALPYIRAVLSDGYRSANLNLGSVLSTWFPAIRFPLSRVISLLVIATVFIEAISAARAPFRRVVWVASLALAATPLIGLAMFPSNYVVLILPLVLIVALVWERWRRSKVAVVILILMVALALPFGLYIQTILRYAPLYTQLLSVLPPVAAIIGLYWMRWWVLHSPRTWADQIGSHK